MQPTGFTSAEVARHLNISIDALERLCRRYGRYLSPDMAAPDARLRHATFSQADVATLVMLKNLIDQGYDDAQIEDSLTPHPLPPAADAETKDAPPATALATTQDSADDAIEPAGLARLVSDAMNTLAGTQQAVLNSQGSLREVLNVVVQDNFNLKDENRKLRDRMLELERALAEYQRREETRKERSEGRLRALEATVAALQQQVSQLIQIQRQQQRRRGWFG
jgi:regulator of replication initiation timing